MLNASIPTVKIMCWSGAAWSVATWKEPWLNPTSSSKTSTRPALSSTPTSSPKPDLPGASATDRDSGLHPGPVHGSRRHRQNSGDRARSGANYSDRRRRRLRRQARSFRSALRRVGRVASAPTGAHGLFAHRNRSSRPPSAIRRSIRLRAGATRDGKLTAHGLHRRLQHGRLLFLGTDGGGARSRARLRALQRAALPRADPGGAHASGAGRGLPRISASRKRRSRRNSSTTISPTDLGIDRLEFRILNALDDETPTVTGQVLGEGVGIRACFEALRPQVDSCARRSCGFQRADQRSDPARRGRRRHVVRMRQHFPAESLHRSRGIEGGRPHRASPGRGGYRTGLEHYRHPNLRRRPAALPSIASIWFPEILSITPDCGKTSASRQTFVTGKAAHMAGTELRRGILRPGRRV